MSPPRAQRRRARSTGRAGAPGKVRHPFPGQDFSSFLLQAQTSKAKTIGLANAGPDTINAIKQASEFGIVQGGQNLATLLAFSTDVHALRLKTAQGLIMTEAWYWDLNEPSRTWAKRFAAANNGKYPSMVQAGVYSSMLHYLKAIEAIKSDDGTKVVEQMKKMPTDDPLFGKGSIRVDGRKIHPAYLVVVKKPSEGREVLAVPGPIGDGRHRGSHRLLQQGATLVTGVEDVLDALAPALRTRLADGRARVAVAGLSDDERQVLDAVGDEDVHVDEVSRRAGRTAAVSLETLLALELRGLVEQRPGARFVKRRAA